MIEKIEMLRAEKVLIVVNDLQEKSVLAAVAAIQGYRNSAAAKHRSWCAMVRAQSKLTLDLHVVLPSAIASTFGEMFKTLCRETKFWSDAQCPSDLSDYDAVFDMSESKARSLDTGNRQLAQLMGILVGGENESLPSDVQNLMPSYTVGDCVLTSERFLSACRNCGIQLPSGMPYTTNSSTSLEFRIEEVFAAKAVLDFCGFETYLAAALHKPVIEINNDPLLTKWSSPNYFMLTELDEKGLRRALRLCKLE